jgi:integrase
MSNTNIENSKLPKYLMLRGGIYYFKRRVPANVICNIELEKANNGKSLNTRKLDEAIKLLAVELRAYEVILSSMKSKKVPFSGRLVKQPKRGEGTTKYLLEEHIPLLLSRYEYAYLSTDDEERTRMSREDRAERLEFLEESLNQYVDLVATEDYSLIMEVAADILSQERLIAPPGSAAHVQFVKALMQKDIEILEIQRGRLLGKMTLTPKNIPTPPRDMPTLLTAVGLWQAKQTEVRTIGTYTSVVQEFEAVNGALPLVAITTGHASLFRDHLASDELSRETVVNRIGLLSTIFRYALTGKLCPQIANPFEAVSFDKLPVRPAYLDRRAYEIDELNRLYHSPLYTGGARPKGQAAESSYWAPLLGPFVGARIEEIAQLRVDDIQRINGVWALRIANLDENQHIKTASSYRLVPVHSEVIKLGFLNYLDEIKIRNCKYLFPSQENNNINRRWSNALGKWYSGYLDDIGLVDDRLCYHSFRFTFKQRCTSCGIEGEVRDALTGHWVSPKTPSRNYVKTANRQYPFPALVAAIEKLRYDELDLSHLYVS